MGELLTLQQVAERLHVSVQSVRDWTFAGFRGVLLRTVPAGRRKLVKPEWIEQFQADIERVKQAHKEVAKATAPNRKAAAKTKAGLKRHGLRTKQGKETRP